MDELRARLREHPDYHEGFHHGATVNLDAMRGGYETTPEYCAGFDAGRIARSTLDQMQSRKGQG